MRFPLFFQCAFFIFLSLFRVCICAQDSPVSLTADHLYYAEDVHQVFASSNVKLGYQDVEIKASHLQLDTLSNTVWGTGNIQVKRGEDQFESSYLFYNLDSHEMSLQNIHVAMTPQEGKSTLFLKAQELHDTGKAQSGQEAKFTTCSLEDPTHYFISAKRFDYYPNQRVIGYDVFVYQPILFIPFGFWTPYYRYELGKRRVIWNFPVVGKKEETGWGWYMQNTIDYALVNGKDSSVFFDIFENKGFGLGVRHQYDLQQHQGSLLYYRLDELDTHLLNEKTEWTDTFKLSDNLDVTLGYKKIDATRINGFGRQKEEAKTISAHYDNLGEVYQWNLADNQNFNQHYRSLSFQLDHQFNQDKIYTLKAIQQDNLAGFRRSTQLYGSRTFRFSEGIIVTTQLDLKKTENTQRLFPSDDTLETNLSFSKPITPELMLNMRINHLADLDAPGITANIQNRNYFYRLPEVILRYTPQWDGWQTRHQLTVARYQEVQYVSQFQTQQTVPKTIDFTVAPNTYILNENISRTFDQLPLLSSLTWSSGYNQYIFSTPGKDLFNGDAMYTLDFNINHSATVFSFLKTDSTFTSVYAPKENRSPFTYFGDKTQQQNIITERWTFFLWDLSRYKWTHETGYDFINNQWRDYRTQLVLKPVSILTMTLASGKKLSPSLFDAHNDYYPTAFNMDLAPTDNASVKLNYSISLDTNEFIYRNRTTLQSSQFGFKVPLGPNPDYRWEIGLGFVYNTLSQEGNFDPRRYELQTVNIVKREHCRTLSFGYNKTSDEFMFRYTIDAFPEDPIEFIRNKANWKVGGRLNQSAQERF